MLSSKNDYDLNNFSFGAQKIAPKPLKKRASSTMRKPSPKLRKIPTQVLSEINSASSPIHKMSSISSKSGTQVDQNFLLGGNKLLKLIEPGTVRKILRGSQFIKVRENQVLYKEGDPARNHSYIVLIGQLTLHSNYYQKVCTVERGDTLGEEGLFE